MLYRYAEQVPNAAASAESVAHSMAEGFESEVTIAVDVLQRVGDLVDAFEVFSEQFPHTRIRVLETSLSGTSGALLEKQADLVIGGAMSIGFNGAPLTTIAMLPVAAPSHPLVKDRKNVSELELKSHRQIVLRNTGTKREQDAGWLGAQQR